MEKKKYNIKQVIYIMLSVLICMVFAIFFHAILPTDANATIMNSWFVETLGFPIVASLYFLILYTHCAITMLYFGNRSSLNKWELALRFGIAYGILYQIGMFELVPGSTWNLQIGWNQFWVGFGDFVPVLLLCVLLSKSLKIKERNKKILLVQRSDITLIATVAIGFIIFRMIGYYTGVVVSSIKEYFIPVVVWTVLFGITMGYAVALLRPIFSNDNKVKVTSIFWSIGINWFWFNSFMTLIVSGIFFVIALRVTVDIVGVCLILWFRNISID